MNLPLEQHNTTTTKYSCFINSNNIGYKYLLSRAYNIKKHKSAWWRINKQNIQNRTSIISARYNLHTNQQNTA